MVGRSGLCSETKVGPGIHHHSIKLDWGLQAGLMTGRRVSTSAVSSLLWSIYTGRELSTEISSRRISCSVMISSPPVSQSQPPPTLQTRRVMSNSWISGFPSDWSLAVKPGRSAGPRSTWRQRSSSTRDMIEPWTSGLSGSSCSSC